VSVVCLFFLSGWIRQIAGAIVKSVHSMESMIKRRCKAIVESAIEIMRLFAFLASVSIYLLSSSRLWLAISCRKIVVWKARLVRVESAIFDCDW
jgi:hypothetical protein